MKKLLLLVCAYSFAAGVQAQGFKTPQPSPSQTIKQDFGVGSIELSYSRPGVKGRKVFGDLVPYGKIWRTGANSPTTIMFSDSVVIGGTPVPPGKYGLLSIPNKNEWNLIITKQLNVSSSPAAYKPENDVVRVTAKPVQLPTPVETFTMQFTDVKPTSTNLQMMWDDVAVTLPIATNIDTKIMAQIASVMRADTRPYFQAAVYYLENGKDLNQAATWLDKAIEQNPDAFWIHYQKARVLAKMGKKQDAKAAAQKSIELAKAAKNDDYVELNKKLIDGLK